jgi:hypothetical protein
MTREADGFIIYFYFYYLFSVVAVLISMEADSYSKNWRIPVQRRRRLFSARFFLMPRPS